MQGGNPFRQKPTQQAPKSQGQRQVQGALPGAPKGALS